MSRLALLRERRTWRAAGLVAAAIVVLSAPWWAPRALSHLAFFHVRHVDVVGARYIDHAALVALMGVDTSRSVWDDTRPLAARLAAHPQVADVRVSRRLPGTLVVTVTEEPPVAFVSSARGMIPLAATGDTLPIDPLQADLTLPLVPRADSTVLHLLGALRRESPALFLRISEVRRASADELLIDMPPLRVRAMTDLSSARLADILPVERDLARRQARPLELDLRFRGQVVARVQ